MVIDNVGIVAHATPDFREPAAKMRELAAKRVELGAAIKRAEAALPTADREDVRAAAAALLDGKAAKDPHRKRREAEQQLEALRSEHAIVEQAVDLA